MPLSTHSIPEQISGAILMALQKELVYSRIFNRDYEGEVTPGASVKIVSQGSHVTIGDYTRESDIAWQFVSDDSQTLLIDQEKYFAISVDDLDALQSKPNSLAAYAVDAAYQLSDTIDQFLVSKLAGASGAITADLGDNTTPLEINSANIGSTLRLIARRLDDAKVPRQRRVVVLPPWAVEDLVTANIADASNNAEELTNGFVARYAGFNILMSNNVPNTAGDKHKIVAGSDIAATFAIQMNKTEQMRLESKFADGIRGLAAYGAKVTRPGALAVATWNEAAEA